MLQQIAKNRQELQDICRRFHVRRLDLFGSAARGDFIAGRSDFDFLVEFESGRPEAQSMKTFLRLKESLETLLGTSVDLVEPGAIRNPYVRASVESSRERVFEA